MLRPRLLCSRQLLPRTGKLRGRCLRLVLPVISLLLRLLELSLELLDALVLLRKLTLRFGLQRGELLLHGRQVGGRQHVKSAAEAE